MVSATGITNLKDVKPFKTGWRIEVKAIHSWKQYTPINGESLELILTDATGVKIHASFKKQYVLRVQKQLPIGQWRVVENFSLTPASGQYRPTNHVYKIVIIGNTWVTPSELKLDDNFLSLASFESITNGTLKAHFLVDVMGQVLDVAPIQTVQVMGKERKKIEFVLRNTDDQRLACCLWGKFAEQIVDAYEQANDQTLICCIRFAKINHYKEKLQITNAFDASIVIINPSYPEAEEFVHKLKADGFSLSIADNDNGNLRLMDRNDQWYDFPEITVSKILMAFEEGKIRVKATISGNDFDWAWYYIAHKSCNKRVIEIKRSGSALTAKASQRLFRCDTCNDNVTDVNVTSKFKLHLIIKDDTSDIKIMMLDTVAESIVGKSSATLLNGSLDEMEDPTLLPEEIKSLVGKTFQFGVCINKDNVFYGHEIYKVGKVWGIDEILKIEPNSESENQTKPFSSTISSDQVSMIEINSEETSEICSTPEAKRKKEIEEVADLTSTSKKQCMKVIKQERID